MRNFIEIFTIVLLLVALVCTIVRCVKTGDKQSVIVVIALGLSTLCIILRRFGR